MVTFEDALFWLREQYKTRSDLARAIKIPAITIKRIEEGKAVPSDDTKKIVFEQYEKLQTQRNEWGQIEVKLGTAAVLYAVQMAQSTENDLLAQYKRARNHRIYVEQHFLNKLKDLQDPPANRTISKQ